MTQQNHWEYKGWSIDYDHDGGYPKYKIHGPNSKDLRARKVVLSLKAAQAYIDGKVQA